MPWEVDDAEEELRRFVYTTITIDEADMRALDPAQEFLEPGDDVLLGGYVPEPGPLGSMANPAFDLIVNGVARYNWRHWDDLPTQVQDRLRHALQEK